MLVAVAATQVPGPSPSPLTGGPAFPPPVGIEGHYGPAEPEDLDQIAYNGASYQKRNVIVKGKLGHLVTGRYLSLNEGTARVMLIPFQPGDYRDFLTFVGIEVEVTGIVRILPTSQKSVRCHGEPHLESKCEDFLLPELPDAQPGLPASTITVVKLTDRGKGPAVRRGGARTLADTGVEAAAAAGKPVHAIGQFRGANLCHDLPPESRRDPGDWVLLTSEGPLWVTGRRPEGSGFRLDPAYRGDTSRWLEVRGRVEIAGEARFLRATRISLVPRPEDGESRPCPP